jgi:hypothetical protein
MWRYLSSVLHPVVAHKLFLFCEFQNLLFRKPSIPLKMTATNINQQEFDVTLTWGLFIYRTVYSSESDALWPIILCRIQDYSVKNVEGHTRPSQKEKDVKSWYQTLTFDNQELFGEATIQELREHHKIWSANNHLIGDIRERNFILIDEECLQNLALAPEVPVSETVADGER